MSIPSARRGRIIPPILLLVLVACSAGVAQSDTSEAGRVQNEPYLEQIGRRADITIWTVDGVYIRNFIDGEFTNFGQHYSCPVVPEHEFWIDKEGKKDETEFFIDHLVTEYRLMASGGVVWRGSREGGQRGNGRTKTIRRS